MTSIGKLLVKIEKMKRKLNETKRPCERQRLSEEIDKLIIQYYRLKELINTSEPVTASPIKSLDNSNYN